MPPTHIGPPTRFPAAVIVDSYFPNPSATSSKYLNNIQFAAGQSFTNTSTVTLDSSVFYLRKFGSPTGNITARIYDHTGTYGTNSLPTGSPLATSDTVSAATIATTRTLHTFTFSGANRIILSANTKYCTVISYSSGTAVNYIEVIAYLSNHSGNGFVGDTSLVWNIVTFPSDDFDFYVHGVPPAHIGPPTHIASNSNSLDLERSSSQYASISDAAQTGLDLSDDFTIEAWIKLESIPASNGDTYAIASKYNSGAVQRSYEFSVANIAGVTNLELNVATSTPSPGFTRDTILQAWTPVVDKWYHVAVTFDVSNPTATEAEFFVDGVSIGNGTVALDNNISSIFNGTAAFVIGAWANPLHYFDGLIDDVRVWNDIRTSTEISTNMSLQLAGNEANLVGYWKLNSTYQDSTANANHLTAVNGPVFAESVPFQKLHTN